MQEEMTTSADQAVAAQTAAARQEEQIIKQLGQQVQKLALSSSRDAGQAQDPMRIFTHAGTGQLSRSSNYVCCLRLVAPLLISRRGGQSGIVEKDCHVASA